MYVVFIPKLHILLYDEQNFPVTVARSETPAPPTGLPKVDVLERPPCDRTTVRDVWACIVVVQSSAEILRRTSWVRRAGTFVACWCPCATPAATRAPTSTWPRPRETPTTSTRFSSVSIHVFAFSLLLPTFFSYYRPRSRGDLYVIQLSRVV